jgi:hypothetical protein
VLRPGGGADVLHIVFQRKRACSCLGVEVEAQQYFLPLPVDGRFKPQP